MKDKLTIQELAEFINGRNIAESATEGVFLAMMCDGKVYGSVSGNSEVIHKAMTSMIASNPDLIAFLSGAIANGMYTKGMIDAQGETTKGFEV